MEMWSILNIRYITSIGVARETEGVHWVHVHPQGGENFFLGQIYRESCKCTPRQSAPPEAEQESIFLGNWGDVDGG